MPLRALDKTIKLKNLLAKFTQLTTYLESNDPQDVTNFIEIFNTLSMQEKEKYVSTPIIYEYLHTHNLFHSSIHE